MQLRDTIAKRFANAEMLIPTDGGKNAVRYIYKDVIDLILKSSPAKASILQN